MLFLMPSDFLSLTTHFNQQPWLQIVWLTLNSLDLFPKIKNNIGSTKNIQRHT